MRINFFSILQFLSLLIFLILVINYENENENENLQCHFFYDNKKYSDLCEILNALIAYKNHNKQYPISSNNGNGFDGLISDFGESKIDWIKGITPKYMKILPTQSVHPHQQYLYISDGANFKLIAHNVDDCEDTKKLLPKMIDPVRMCWAYGYWTKRAKCW